MPIPNPYNGYVPKVGERVRIVGGCHPMSLGKVVEVTKVYEENGRKLFKCKHYRRPPHHGSPEMYYTGGEIGGLEPAPGHEISIFD